MPTADVDCLCVSSQQPQRRSADVETFPSVINAFLGLFCPSRTPRFLPHKVTRRKATQSQVTFDNIAVNRSPEFLSRLLVEVLAVNDPHLFEESRLAALASAQQQDLHQPLHVRFLPGQSFVDLPGLSDLLRLAGVKQAGGQTNF